MIWQVQLTNYTYLSFQKLKYKDNVPRFFLSPALLCRDNNHLCPGLVYQMTLTPSSPDDTHTIVTTSVSMLQMSRRWRTMHMTRCMRHVTCRCVTRGATPTPRATPMQQATPTRRPALCLPSPSWLSWGMASTTSVMALLSVGVQLKGSEGKPDMSTVLFLPQGLNMYTVHHEYNSVDKCGRD